MRSIVIMAAALLALGVIAVRFVDQTSRAHSGNAAMTASPKASSAPSSSSNNSRSVTLNKGNGGHFWTEARVDGRRIEFVVDTGASAIALRESDAARLGIHPTARDYTVKVNTANGVSRAAPVDLRMVEIGNVVVRDVRALVHPDNGLGINLLGMTFLGKVRWTHDRGKLIIEQ
jgi:aspartyl protease family protein